MEERTYRRVRDALDDILAEAMVVVGQEKFSGRRFPLISTAFRSLRA
jgi:hypothetical protein